MKTSIDERLQHYLDRIAAGETVDALLPEIEAEAEGAELARLVALSASAMEVLPKPMAAARRGRMQADLQDAFAAAHSKKEAKRVGIFSSWLRPIPRLAALALSLVLLATTGVVVQAEDSVPGDALYGVKRVAENARMALTADPLRRARLQLRLADRRLDELQRLADRGAAIDANLIDELMERHEAILEQTQRLDDPKLVESVREVVQEHLARIGELAPEIEDAGERERVEQIEYGLRDIEAKLPTAVAAPLEDAPDAVIPTDAPRNDPGLATRKARVTPSPRATNIRMLPTRSVVPATPTEGAGGIAPQPGPSIVPPGSTALPPSAEPPGIVMTVVPGTPIVRPTRPVRLTAEAARRATQAAVIPRETKRAERKKATEEAREKLRIRMATQQAKKRRATDEARKRQADRRATQVAKQTAEAQPTRGPRPTRTPPSDRRPHPSPTQAPLPSATP